jgi:hypothetical protein
MPQLDQSKMNPLSDAISTFSTDVETGTPTNDGTNTRKGHRSNETRSRTRLWYILGGVSVLVLAAVVVVAVLVLVGSNDQMTPQQQKLSEIAKSISSKKDLQNSASPQNMAYNWLIHKDTFYNNARTITRELAVQRYVLAVFYYATMGDKNWGTASNWLQGNECLDNWLGVSCNDQGSIRTLEFGKFYPPPVG